MRQNNHYRVPIFLAILLHVVLFAGLFIHFASKTISSDQSNIIHAVAVSSHAVKPSSESHLKKEEEKTKEQQKLLQQKLAHQQQEEQQKELIKAQQKQEEEKQLALQQQAQIAMQQKMELAKRKQAQALAAKKKAQQQKQQQLAQLKAAQQKLLQQQLAQEDQQLTATAKAQATQAALSQQQQGEVDKYKAKIIQAISQNWLVPDNVDKNLVCQLLVNVGPGGVVLSVQMVKSSGDPLLDRSATNAVYKASPLPVPPEPELFDKFRTLRLTVKPEKIVAGM